jgi:hypothetical protein
MASGGASCRAASDAMAGVWGHCNESLLSGPQLLSSHDAVLRLGHLTFNQRVVGSIPTALTKPVNDLRRISFRG